MTAPSLSLRSNINLQYQSPLFSVLPAEIRSLIFKYALTDYEDITTHMSYDRDTYWYRPGYMAKRRTATELLRTCKRIFQETWFLPFALAEHCFYLTNTARAPSEHVTVARMKEYLTTLRDFARNQDGMEIPQIERIRVFAQMFVLEDSPRLQEVLDMEGFQPKHITITLRYTDFWFWEHNSPIHIDAKWVNTVRFPKSVATISMDFEMVDRRKEEIDYITNLAVDKWFFRRADGIVFKANKEDIKTSRWTGSSTLGDARWIRDESRTNEIDYYVKTVTWKPVPEFDPFTGGGDGCPNLDIPHDFPRQTPPFGRMPNVPVDDLQYLDCSDNLSAQQVYDSILGMDEEMWEEAMSEEEMSEEGMSEEEMSEEGMSEEEMSEEEMSV
ncbi:conserved hypothetical protein [Talaromyces stipitatus ATCC 10500]|uniref:F-box domain protein n=1 Tax=Talaromyces stipitatus (strain ATCC 10500 / CBS 375.48 / QM 6759 / NRRL 1006) TaxID=441959 RepID=B8MND3_TALSN|nr:uncharacterized protein TSTA_102520 [Talaromyces stipitatus ATCC 10500]EED14022.1 conserved hypothetical protein [Talaromyces stipitatus ATCC 10500]